MSDILSRLMARVIVNEESTCWEWQGAKSLAGYGQIWDRKKAMYTHRVSYEQHRGAIPEGLCVLHQCDNRKCCNPDHLFLGTNQDNMDDMKAKGRHAINNPGHREKLKKGQSRRDKASYARGERAGLAILTAEKVAVARRDYVPGVVTLSDLAARLGVSRYAIKDAVARRTWKHITP